MFFFGMGGAGVQEKQVKEVKALMEEKNQQVLLLDVRTPSEYEQARVKDSKLIPLNELSLRMDEISGYKNKEVLVICRSGNRSASATAMLQNAGFTQAYNVSGGVSAWHQQGLPLV